MKFAEHLTAHITPEWRKQYITYEVGTDSGRKLQVANHLLYSYI